jgi:hypothetical protein
VTDDDAVLAYRNDDDDAFLLNEEDALQSEDEIFFIGVGEIPDNVDEQPFIIDGGSDYTATEEFASLRSTQTMELDRHQVKAGFRFDNNNLSEIKSWRLYFNPNIVDPTPRLDTWDFNKVKIHKNNINNSVIFTNDLGGFNIGTSDFFDNNLQVFLGTYEYDWYASPKVIENTCSNFIAHSVKLRRKYSEEFYFADCGTFPSFWPTHSSRTIFSNEKCMFDVRRW